MKRILAVLLTVCLMATLAPFAVSAAGATATMSSVVASKDRTAVLTVSLKNAPETDAMGIALSVLPEGVTLVDATWKVTGGMIADFNMESLKGVWAAASAEDINGKVIELTFKVADDAPCSDYEIGFEFYVDTTSDKAANVTENMGVITVDHNYGKEWSHNGKEHWRECTACGNKKDIETHSIEDEVCTVCGRKVITATMGSVVASEDRTAVLTVSLKNAPETNAMGIALSVLPEGVTLVDATWKVTGGKIADFSKESLEGVWAAASAKDINGKVIELTFKVADDAPCGDYEIGFEFYTDTTDDKVINVTENMGVITVSHNYSKEWSHNGTSHWHVCTACGEKSEAEAHNVEDDVCTVCGREVITATMASLFAEKGETVVLEITLKNAPKTKAMAIQLQRLPEGIELVKAEWKATGGMLIDFDLENTEGVWAGESEVDANGKVFEITFKVDDNADFGDYEIGFEFCTDTTDDKYENVAEVCGVITICDHKYGDEWMSDDDCHWQICAVCGHVSEKEEHNVEDGFCTDCGMEFFVSGDVDGVDGVDASDAIYLLYNVFFGEERYPVNQGCDYDGNGEVEADDAIYLLYYVFFGDTKYPLN